MLAKRFFQLLVLICLCAFALPACTTADIEYDEPTLSGASLATASEVGLDKSAESEPADPQPAQQTSVATIDSPHGPQFTTVDLVSNRGGQMPADTLQIAIWYDGSVDPNSPPILSLEFAQPSSDERQWVTIGGSDDAAGRLSTFEQINTRQYQLNGWRPTGRFEIRGVVGNGAIDGLAFGTFARFADGNYDVMKSVAPTLSGSADFVGAWPVGLWDKRVMETTPQITDNFGREQLRMMLYGAQYMQNGSYQLSLTPVVQVD